jgi:glyoxylase-like metal-dependent hydrolase (beta-lactamase superfamily II)
VLRKIGIGLAFIGVVLVAVFLWGTVPTASPRECVFGFDLATARALAGSIAGDKPSSIHVEHIATFRAPGAVIRAGAPWAMVELRVFAYQLRFADRTIILDVAMNEAQARESHASAFEPAAFARLETALAAASAIYVTHEHADHMGSVFAGPTPPKQLRLTSEQIASDRSKPLVISEAAKRVLSPLVYDDMTALAPGLVAIKAPGHTPGSQWFFVSLASGGELLIVGDTAWHMMNIEHVQGPPRLASLMLKNDRQANACQLIALKRLLESEPKLGIVPGHDGPRIEELIAAGTLVRGF